MLEQGRDAIFGVANDGRSKRGRREKGRHQKWSRTRNTNNNVLKDKDARDKDAQFMFQVQRIWNNLIWERFKQKGSGCNCKQQNYSGKVQKLLRICCFTQRLRIWATKLLLQNASFRVNLFLSENITPGYLAFGGLLKLVAFELQTEEKL